MICDIPCVSRRTEQVRARSILDLLRACVLLAIFFLIFPLFPFPFFLPCTESLEARRGVASRLLELRDSTTSSSDGPSAPRPPSRQFLLTGRVHPSGTRARPRASNDSSPVSRTPDPPIVVASQEPREDWIELDSFWIVAPSIGDPSFSSVAKERRGEEEKKRSELEALSAQPSN